MRKSELSEEDFARHIQAHVQEALRGIDRIMVDLDRMTDRLSAYSNVGQALDNCPTTTQIDAIQTYLSGVGSSLHAIAVLKQLITEVK